MGSLVILFVAIVSGCIFSGVYILSKDRKNKEYSKNICNDSYSAQVHIMILMSMSSLAYGVIMLMMIYRGKIAIIRNSVLVYSIIGVLNLASCLIKGTVAGNILCKLVDKPQNNIFSRTLIKMGVAEVLAIIGFILFLVLL